MDGKKDIAYYMELPYNIIIRKDPYGGYFAKIEELEGCMAQGETYEEAFKNIREAMELWLEDAIADGDDIPEPDRGEENFSGKFVLRLPKTLHRKLARNAYKENVSLNQYVVFLLSERNILTHQ
ncbi:MAG TPA: type II toxin-antitoxin system HicB family antitoxin [Candidatus Deferrimicrobium sp.]|nr:type II toxin-antitoxin system HicB family antitoxin [Candidatus Kapabacteria bacterium]HLP60429.1 type II toxin-antitoxin system HicB family antitoxin [Candidatus Deferrimicrobium sp.]